MRDGADRFGVPGRGAAVVSRRRGRRPRPGRWLPAIDAAPLVEGDEELCQLDGRLTADGWRRTATVRPYLAKNGLMTLRFVWRKRSEGLTAKYEVVWRVPLKALREGGAREEAA